MLLAVSVTPPGAVPWVIELRAPPSTSTQQARQCQQPQAPVARLQRSKGDPRWEGAWPLLSGGGCGRPGPASDCPRAEPPPRRARRPAARTPLPPPTPPRVRSGSRQPSAARRAPPLRRRPSPPPPPRAPRTPRRPGFIVTWARRPRLAAAAARCRHAASASRVTTTPSGSMRSPSTRRTGAHLLAAHLLHALVVLGIHRLELRALIRPVNHAVLAEALEVRRLAQGERSSSGGGSGSLALLAVLSGGGDNAVAPHDEARHFLVHRAVS